MITLEDLMAFKPESMFAYGARLVYSEDSIYRWQKWVAVRGYIHDWAIYEVNPWEDPMNWDWGRIKTNGDKIHSRFTVQELVPADDEALAMYRD